MDEQIQKGFDDMNKRFDELVIFLSETVATKADIANMATKDDIANMATKDDIAQLETKLDAKIDLVRNDLMGEIGEVRVDIKSLKKGAFELDTRIKEDLDVYATDIVSLKKRTTRIESSIELQPAV